MKDNFKDFVQQDLAEYYNKLRPVYLEWTEGKTDDCLSYYNNHIERFEAMEKLIRKNNVDTSSIAELGSFLPYTSFAFKPDIVDCYDIVPIMFNIDNFQYENYGFYGMNLCKELPMKPYTLRIISEVIEHLPCNLIDFQTRLANSMASGEYLLVTYPMHGHNAKDYNVDFGDHDVMRAEHVREFNNETYKQFFNMLNVVDEADVHYWAYGHIKLVLYRK